MGVVQMFDREVSELLTMVETLSPKVLVIREKDLLIVSDTFKDVSFDKRREMVAEGLRQKFNVIPYTLSEFRELVESRDEEVMRLLSEGKIVLGYHIVFSLLTFGEEQMEEA
ncbi:MAG: hypothetical protein ACTSXJ_06605 [Candidatus Baldrarchaeia archaeon]